MRKHRLLALAFSMAVACAGGGGEEASTPGSGTNGTAPSAPIDLDTAGRIIGKVILHGDPPEPKSISMAADPLCAQMHTRELRTELAVTNPDGTLRNVFVYVKEGLEGRHFPPPAEPAVLTQRGCVYVPHVLGVTAGQPLEILNDDDTLHNVRAAAEKNRPFNLGQPRRGHKVSRTFRIPEIMVPIKCDVHKWMSAYVGVVEHPYFDVTGDGGAFELSGLPPGDYVLEAWHEMFGTRSTSVRLAEKETREIVFAYRTSDAKTR